MNQSMEKPYIGPRTFEENERDRFFGREREARELLALVVSQQLVLFYAQSGAGKSSLVNTRLVPDLKSKGFEVVQGRVGGDAPVGIKVDNIYVFNLARSSTPNEIDPGPLSSLSLSESFAKRRNQALPEVGLNDERQGSKRHALIIDQFEELFHTHPEAWKKREDFFQQLAQAMEDNPSLWVILIMREDFIAALDPYAHLLPGRLRMRYYMQRLERDAALEAIKRPVKDIRPYAEGVAEELVDDLARVKIYKPDGTFDFQLGQYVEPVQLQVVCYSLWDKLKPGKAQITQEDLKEHVHDVDQSLEEHYARRVREVADLKKVSERAIRDWFGNKLITAGGVRNMVLQETNKREGTLDDDVIQALQSDLVRAEMRGGATFYELTHDRLVEPILENNRQWNIANSSPFRLQAEAWKDSSDKIHLLSDLALDKADQWAKDNQSKLTDVDIKFLAACRSNQKERDEERERETQREKAEQEREAQQLKLESAQELADEQARSARRQRRFTLIAVSLFILALIAAGLAGISWNSARNQEAKAVAQRSTAVAAEATAEAAQALADQQTRLMFANEIAVRSQSFLDTNKPLSLLLAIEALDHAQNAGMPQPSQLATADHVLREAAKLATGAGIMLSGSAQPIYVVAFSPDGRWLASGGVDSNVRLWDVTGTDPSGNPIILSGHTGTINWLAFSPDDHWLASGSDDGTIRLWDMTAEDKAANPSVLTGKISSIWRLAFSPDSHSLAGGGIDGDLQLWDLTSQDKAAKPTTLTGHKGNIYALAFSPDGHWLATGSDATGSHDSTLLLWDMTAEDKAAHPIALKGHTSSVYSVAFSPDGHWLASGGEDSTVRLWDMTAEDKTANPIVLSGHTDYIWRLTFSPDGHWLASAGGDSTVRLWDMTAEDKASDPIVLSGNTSPIYSLAFSLDGHWLASGSSDGKVQVWNRAAESKTATPIVLSGSTSAINSLALSPDGRWLASGSDDGTVELWDASTQFNIENSISQYVAVDQLEANTSQITNLAFSPPDGIWLASANTGSDAQLWNFQTGIPTEASATLAGPVYSLAYDPKSVALYAGSEHETIYSWHLGADDPARTADNNFPDLHGILSTLVYCPTSSCWASANGNQTELYLAGNNTHLVELSGKQKADVRSLAISPDNSWLASGNADASINVWRLYDPSAQTPQSGVDITSIMGPIVLSQSSPGHFLTFSPDSHWLASGGEDGTISVWETSGWDAAGNNVPGKAHYEFKGTAGPVYALAFSPGGRWLASGGSDANIKLWDMSNPTSGPVILKSDEVAIFALAFSPDGSWLVSGGSNNKVQVWGSSIFQLKSEACRTVGRNLEWQEWKSVFKNEDYHITCPDNPFPSSVADHFLHPGDELASKQDINGAVAQYEEALVECPIERCPGFRKDYISDLTARADNQAAQALLEEGDRLAQKANIDEAISKYQEALKFDPKIIPDNGTPELRAKQTAKQIFYNPYYAGDYQGAASEFEILQGIYPDVFTVDDASSLNDTCWWESTSGRASNVKDVCESAVKLDPQNASYIDSRGLNRALLGDYLGAIEDFEFFIKSRRESGDDPNNRIAEREAWVKALKAGKNPFDKATLDRLYKNE